MSLLAIVNAAAATCTIVAAVLVASNYSPKVMVWGFVVFAVASVLWIFSGFWDNQFSLVIQNIVLLLVNLFGIWRWLPKAT